MSTPNDMRRYLAIMRGTEPVKSSKVEEKIVMKEMSMRDMLGKMRSMKSSNKNEPSNNVLGKIRNLNEAEEVNIATNIDKTSEEHKLNNYFNDNNVTIEFEDLKVYPNGVIFGGSIDGQILFVYKVTPEEESSGVEIDYLDGFDAQDPENVEVVKKIESYFNIFYKHWRNSLFQNN